MEELRVKVITSTKGRLNLNPNEIDVAVIFDDPDLEMFGATLLVTYFPNIQRRFVSPEFVRSESLATEGFQSFVCTDLKTTRDLVLKLERLFPDKKVKIVE